MKMKKSNKMNASNNGYRPCEQGWQNETKKKKHVILGFFV